MSFHTVYELARNFERDDLSGSARGQQLFAYLKRYLDLDMPCTKELWEQIVAEAYAFENNLLEIDPMATPEQCALTRQEVEKLAHGIVEGKVKTFLEERRQFSEDTRAQQKAHMIGRKELNQYLRRISESQLARWMASETLTDSGVSALYRRFNKRIGPGATPEYIRGLLHFPLAEAARGSVHADLYYNWHCAQHGLVRFDLLDDMLHLLQAIYCDWYITEEKKQLRYASLLLTSRTRVTIYPDRSIPVGNWIVTNVDTISNDVAKAFRCAV